MNCKKCGCKMLALENLVSTKSEDVKSWPLVEWCPDCGSLYLEAGGEKKFITPVGEVSDED